MIEMKYVRLINFNAYKAPGSEGYKLTMFPDDDGLELPPIHEDHVIAVMDVLNHPDFQKSVFNRVVDEMKSLAMEKLDT